MTKKIVSICIAIITLAFLSTMIILFNQSKPTTEPVPVLEFDVNELSEQTTQYEGYATLREWYNVFETNIINYAGKAEATIAEYEGYISDEQAQQLRSLEDSIIGAESIQEQRDAIVEFDKMVSELAQYKEEKDAELAAAAEAEAASYSEESYGGGSYTGDTASFRSQGVIYENGIRYTWYSQNVLPGGGLDIPGRHVGEDNLIHDEDGYVVVASNDHAQGTVVDTPFGEGKVYDSGCDSGTIDIYTNF